MKQDRKYVDKKNYKDSIFEVIIQEIRRSNNYIESQYTKIEETNTEIRKIGTELIALEQLQNDNFNLINADAKINKEFNQIPITEFFRETINEISVEIDSNYQHLFIKKRTTEKIFDFELIRIITQRIILSSYKSIRLFHTFRRKKTMKKGKSNDFQPLDRYISNLNEIINKTLSESLKIEAEKELEFFIDIKNKYKQFNCNNELYTLLIQYNKSLMDPGNQRLRFYRFEPVREINQNTCRELERKIKKVLFKIIPLY